MVFARRHELPDPWPGFEGINRYWDTDRKMPAAKILPGEYYVTGQQELVTTVLGSCVAACVRDRIFGIGGMNHFMLPISTDGKGWGGEEDLVSNATRYGNYAMEHMINDILKHGGHKRHLEAKIFGGARVIENLSDVGQRNIEFVRCYLGTEKINLVGEKVGDIHPLKVIYIPATGKAYVKRIKHLHNDTVIKRENAYLDEITQQPVAGEIELF
jgi:chemotaxis protein CheD